LVKHSLAASQYTGREGRFTETALHHLVSRLEKHLEAKRYASGAFDSTSSMKIKQAGWD
jgi:hypothetical protein